MITYGTYKKLSSGNPKILPELSVDFNNDQELTYNDLYSHASDTNHSFFKRFPSTSNEPLTSFIELAIYSSQLNLLLNLTSASDDEIDHIQKTFAAYMSNDNNLKTASQFFNQLLNDQKGIDCLRYFSKQNIEIYNYYLTSNQFKLQEFLNSNITNDIKFAVLQELQIIKEKISDNNTFLDLVINSNNLNVILNYIEIPTGIMQNKSYGIQIWNAQNSDLHIDETEFDKMFGKKMERFYPEYAIKFMLLNQKYDLGVTELTQDAYQAILTFHIDLDDLRNITPERKSEIQEAFLEHMLHSENKAILSCIDYRSYFWVWARYLKDMALDIVLAPVKLYEVLKNVFMNFVYKSDDLNKDLNESLKSYYEDNKIKLHEEIESKIERYDNNNLKQSSGLTNGI